MAMVLPIMPFLQSVVRFLFESNYIFHPAGMAPPHFRSHGAMVDDDAIPGIEENLENFGRPILFKAAFFQPRVDSRRIGCNATSRRLLRAARLGSGGQDAKSDERRRCHITADSGRAAQL